MSNLYTKHMENITRKTVVIPVGGPAQNGKDTIGGKLEKCFTAAGKNVLVIHHADLLKYMAKSMFGWDGQKDEKGRQLLQYMGTDVVRKKRPDFWVEHILSLLDLFDGDWDYVIIPDSRFPNEIDAYKEAGYKTTYIRIVRPNFVSPLTPEQLNHPSETALNDYEPDILVINDGTLEDLDIKAEEIVTILTGGN